jgi:hypothetical protein
MNEEKKVRGKAIIITSIFHYLSTRELRKMGTEIAVEKPFLKKKVLSKHFSLKKKDKKGKKIQSKKH